MSYPDKYFQWHPLTIAQTDMVSLGLQKVRMNDFYTLWAGMAYGGEVAERYFAPATRYGPWTRRVYYNLNGFDHSHTNADPDKEFDRIIMQSGNVRLAWNFIWHWYGAPTSAVHIKQSHWYISPFPQEAYRYIGRLLYVDTAEVISAVTWSDSQSDPNPPPV